MPRLIVRLEGAKLSLGRLHVFLPFYELIEWNAIRLPHNLETGKTIYRGDSTVIRIMGETCEYQVTGAVVGALIEI